MNSVSVESSGTEAGSCDEAIGFCRIAGAARLRMRRNTSFGVTWKPVARRESSPNTWSSISIEFIRALYGYELVCQVVISRAHSKTPHGDPSRGTGKHAGNAKARGWSRLGRSLALPAGRRS